MTSTSRQRPTGTGADPWWGVDDLEAPLVAAPARERPSTGTGRRRSARDARERARRSLAGRIGWFLVGVLVAPIDLLRRLLARSPRLRRLAVRLVVVLAILAVLASSVGVILINNVVIGRTAELGDLDERRRELRRENALLGAQAARLSSPDVVFRRASRELGMVPTDDVPQFIYLVRASHTLTPLQRDRVAAKAQANGQPTEQPATEPNTPAKGD